jgi:hypothetical protein
MPLTIWVIPLTHGWLQTAPRGWKRICTSIRSGLGCAGDRDDLDRSEG